MEAQDIVITEFNEGGYAPVDRFGTWRVAIINGCESLKEENRHEVERHLETDEVFVPITGKSALFVGKERKRVEMEIGKVYNVKLGAWHTIAMEEGAKVLIVENDDTGAENSEFEPF
ncbi:MAG: hypothetical protein E7400_07060 [Ruminococcaceae bacterium]|nr:hypothetical protein [Oscillospiraceae bacterium]